MNALDYLLRFPWVEPLGRALIHFLWQGALIGGGAGLLLRLARRRSAALRHVMAAGALALCVACPLGTFLLLAHPWRVTTAPPAAAIPPTPTAPAAVSAAASSGPAALAVHSMPAARPAAASASPARASAQTVRREELSSESGSAWRKRAVRWAVLLWMAGVFVFGGRLGVGWMRVQGWRGQAQLINNSLLQKRFRELAARLGLPMGRARLLVSRVAALPGPLAMGVFRPAVLLPARVLERLPLAQIEALLAHELAHIRRHDYLWNLLASALEAVLFYHPAVWYLGRELRAASEECCDALAAEISSDRVTYARALAAVAEARASFALGVPAPAAARSPLVARVRRLLGVDVPPEPLLTSRNAGWALALAAVALASAGILYSGKLMAQNNEEADPDVPILEQPAPHGSAVDAAGHPVPGARVRLLQIRGEWNLDNGAVDETLADAEGRFTLKKPVRFHHPAAYREVAEYLLLADAPNLAPGWAALSPDDAPNAERRLTLTPPTRQEFIVKDRAGKPLPGAVVAMRNAYAREGSRTELRRSQLFLPANLGLCRAVADADGHAAVEGLPDASVSFVTSQEGFGENHTHLNKLAGAAQNIPLQVASSLEGRVTDPLGHPVAGALVTLYPKFRYNEYFVGRTDSDGHYRVDKIWSDQEANPKWKDWGKYEVSIRHRDFTAAAREVTFTGRQAISGFDFAAVPGTELVGHVFDPQTRAPITGASVQVDSPSARQTFCTGADGGFRGRVMPGEMFAFFWQPPRNRFVIEERAGGLPTDLRAQVGGDRFPVDLYAPSALGRLGTLRGEVRTADGQPAARCQVVASMPGRLQVPGGGGDALGGVLADDAGKFTMNGFPIGVDFTLNFRAEHNAATGALPVRLDGEALDLPAPMVLQSTLPGGEFLLTDRHGKPRANLSVAVGTVRDSRSYPVQSERLRSDADGILRVAQFVPGARYAVTLVGADQVTRVVNVFFAPEAGAAPSPRRTLVIDAEGIVRLLGSDGQPIPVKRIVSFEADTILDGKRTRWSNDLPVLEREGADAVIPWDKLVGRRGDMGHFLIETDDGAHVRAEGEAPLDGSNRYVVRAAEVARPDTAPDAGIPDVAAHTLAGRVVTPAGEPVAGAAIDLPGVHFQDEKTPPILTGADGVFRAALSPIRSSHLTVAKEGWATAFVTDVPIGKGFRVTLHNDTRLKGRIGGENPGRVNLLLKKNKFTASEDYLDHEVRDMQLRAATDEEGAYDFPIEPGRWRWQASSADGRFANGEINVETGKTADLGAALRRGNDVVFQLVDCQSGQPVPGIEVAIFEQRADRAYGPREGSARTSDAAGRIRWENLPPGKKTFACNRLQHGRPQQGQEQYPYSRWWREDEPREWLRVDYAKQPPTGDDHSSWLEVDAKPDLPPVRILMERGVKIAGRVVGADGKGAPYVAVQAATQQGRGLNNAGTQTDQEGNFSAYLPAGNGIGYRLCAFTFPGQDRPEPGAAAVSEWFQSHPGDERAFQLVMGKGGWFTGRLVTADGQPAAGFKVTASDGSEVSYAARIAAAGPDGRFRLGPLRPGKYKVSPGASEGAPLRRLPGATDTAGEITAEGDTRDLGDIKLPKDVQKAE